MKICILSDSHDNRGHLKAAVADAKERGAEAILHCGDVIAPTALRPLKEFGLPVHVIHGNNMGDTYALFMLAQEQGSIVHYHGQDAGLELCGRRIFMVHYPHYGQAMAITGDWDLVCYGHDHRPKILDVENQKGGSTKVVDPGTIAGIGHDPTYVMGDLTTMEFELLPVPGAGRG